MQIPRTHPDYKARVIPIARRQRSVLSAIGKDEIGMVEKVTGFLSNHQANIETIRATALGDVFAVLALFTADEERMEEIHNNYRDLRPYKVSLVEPVPSMDHVSGSAKTANFTLNVYTFDDQKIVSQTSHVLREHGVDIIDIAGTAFSAPFAGSPMFFIQMRLMVPESSARRLPNALEELRARMHWADLTIEPADAEDDDTTLHAMSGIN